MVSGKVVEGWTWRIIQCLVFVLVRVGDKTGYNHRASDGNNSLFLKSKGRGIGGQTSCDSGEQGCEYSHVRVCDEKLQESAAVRRPVEAKETEDGIKDGK